MRISKTIPFENFDKYITFIISILLLFPIFLQANKVMASYQAITGAKAMALSDAVTANPPHLMAIHYNPAGLSQAREGLVYHQCLTALSFHRRNQFSPDPSFDILNIYQSEDDPIANQSSSHGKSYLYYPLYGDIHGESVNYPLPLGVTYRQLGSRWIMASGSYMPFAWGNQYDSNDPSQYQSYAHYQQHLIYASPGIAYQFNDTFSLGVALGVGQTALGQSSMIRFPNDIMARSKFYNRPGGLGPFDSIANMQLDLRDDTALSFNAGILWKPLPDLQVGCVYRSPIIANPKGTYHIQYSNELLMLTQWCRENPGNDTLLHAPGLGDIDKALESGSLYLEKFQWPDSFQLGIQYQLYNQIKLMLDFQWTHWSGQEKYCLVFEDPNNQLIRLLQAMRQNSIEAQTIIYEKKAKDTLSCHLGLEWQLKESLLIRGGFAYQPQSSEDSYMNLFSMPGVTSISAGLEWRWPNRWVIEQGVAYFRSQNKTIHNNTSQQLNLEDSSNVFFSPYAGQSVSTKVSGFVFSLNVRIPLSQMSYRF